jgi:hypothetical protein
MQEEEDTQDMEHLMAVKELRIRHIGLMMEILDLPRATLLAPLLPSTLLLLRQTFQTIFLFLKYYCHNGKPFVAINTYRLDTTHTGKNIDG